MEAAWQIGLKMKAAYSAAGSTCKIMGSGEKVNHPEGWFKTY
jgi:hypothetical protein